MVKFNAKRNQIILYKNHDDKRVVFTGELKPALLSDFINDYHHRWLEKYSEKVEFQLYKRHRNLIIYFRSDPGLDHLFQDLGKKLLGEFYVVYLDLNHSNDGVFYNVKKEDMPKVVIKNHSTNSLYPLEGEITQESLDRFVQAWRDDPDASAERRSQPIPCLLYTSPSPRDS